MFSGFQKLSHPDNCANGALALCRQCSQDSSYLVVEGCPKSSHPDRANGILCRQCSQDSSYLMVESGKSSQPGTGSPVQLQRVQPATGKKKQSPSSGGVVWVQYNPDAASPQGDLVNSVVSTVSSYNSLWAA